MSSRHTLLIAAPLMCALLTASCATAVDPNARNGATPEASPAARGTPSSAPNPAAVASPSPVPSATMDISPPQVSLGDVTMSLSFEAPRHMLDQVALARADPAQVAAAAADANAAGTSLGAVVLSDMVRVTNNLDPTQAIPADSEQSILRHAVVDVRGRDGSSAVPYLGVTMDVLLDGHPVSFGQAVVPMASLGANPGHLYYGNNVRITQRGTYQVFIRLNRNALLGKDQPQAAQFNVIVR